MHNAHPFLDASFSIQWSKLTADRIVPEMRAALELAQTAVEEIQNLQPGSETYANTFEALEQAMEIVSLPWRKIGHLDSTCDHPDLRKARTEMLPEVSGFFSSIPLNRRLFDRLNAAAGGSEHGTLSAVQRRFVDETLRDFRDAGADLEKPIRQRLKEIESQLAQITKSFSENVLDSTNAYSLVIDDRAQLAGLPDSAIEAAQQAAMKKGIGSEEAPKYRFTLHHPSMFPVLRFADSEDLRKEIFLASSRVGTGAHDNEPLVRDILRLRAEKARLLGCNHFPQWVLQRRMAKDAETAMRFIEELHAKTTTAFELENRELMEYKASKVGGSVEPLEPWDFAYWAEKLRRERFDFDEEELRPYFPVQSVMSGMFAIVERIFGIQVRELTEGSFEAWHPDVRFYEVRDAASGSHIGSFYADWFPRESKRGGAWMGPLMTGTTAADGTLSPHLGYVCGNMTEPVGDKPALLTHREVETVFHEFGHLLHHVLSEVPIPTLAGTNVAWDFVELPSQIMENWCWDREGLDLFARHYKTGEPIPQVLFGKMIETRNFGAARMQMRQLSFGRMDLGLHLYFDPDGKESLDDFIERVLDGYLAPRKTLTPSSVRSFSHLFSDATGYASAYYSYKWAEVLDADAFTRFQAEGIFNRDTGMDFRRHILAMGNAVEPDALFRRFMGRDPDPEALLRRSGLLAG